MVITLIMVKGKELVVMIEDKTGVEDGDEEEVGEVTKITIIMMRGNMEIGVDPTTGKVEEECKEEDKMTV